MIHRSRSISGTRFSEGGLMSAEKMAERRAGMSDQISMKIKHNTLAQIQEDMKNDFQTPLKKEMKNALAKKKKVNKKEML